VPRRNAVARPRNGRQSHDDEWHEDNRKVTCEAMARSLVERGLVSGYVLEVWRGAHQPDVTRLVNVPATEGYHHL
jgi:hypothetical protein